MLSGGLEKKSDFQLEIGVSNDLEGFTLLRSSEIQRIELFHCQTLHDIIVETQFRRDREPIEVFSSSKFNQGGYYKIKEPEKCKDDCEYCYVGDDVCEWVNYQPGYWLWDHIRHQAIIRFFEIWGYNPRSSKKIYRGLGVDRNIESSVAGMLSTLFLTRCVEKDLNGDWIYKGIRPDRIQYKRFKPLNPSAIETCQQIAKHFSLSVKEERENESANQGF